MPVFHLITDRFHPSPGGLEASVLRIAQILSELPDTTVTVYVRSPGNEADETQYPGNIEVALIGNQRTKLEEPLLAGGIWQQYELLTGRNRLDALLIRNAIEKQIRHSGHSRHVLMSFVISGAGFVAQLVATALSLPHIACVRGTDFSGHMYDPLLFPSIAYVTNKGDLIVTTNNTQRQFLGVAFNPQRPIVTIHNSLPDHLLTVDWAAPPLRGVHLVSDCGFSFKKGTHILLPAVKQLVSEGLDIRLSLAGGSEPVREKYWETTKREYAEALGDRINFTNHLPLTEIPAFLAQGHIYCSATLGEGCSQARCAALCMGMPIVTTNCGEMLDVAENISHVRLSPAGDAAAYTTQLRQACIDLLEGAMPIDLAKVAEWRTHFARGRERRQWQELLQTLVTN